MTFRTRALRMVLCLAILPGLTLPASAKTKKPKPATLKVAEIKATAPATTLRIGYLRQKPENQSLQPYFMPVIEDEGLRGARLAIADNNTTGSFTHQQFELKEQIVAADADPSAAFTNLIEQGYRHILLDVPTSSYPLLARMPQASETLLYDVGASDDDLRGELCSPNLLHLLPSRSMRADALAQYLSKKRWKRLFLAIGTQADDQLYAAALRRAAQRFGLNIAAEKVWNHDFGNRRTPESEIPVFTQSEDYDLVAVADESDQFGDFLPFRTWLPRPVAGTQGLTPVSWHPTLEHWGAIQLQNRFRAQARRWMTEVDYAAWLAVRAIGESATRTKSIDFEKVRGFMLSDQFALAGFKGAPLSFRPWDGQLRQPVLLATERSLVAVAPIEGFIHPKNELDTLGYDQPETPCKFNR